MHTSPNARHGIGGRALGSLVIIQVEVEVVVIARGGGGVVDRERIAPLHAQRSVRKTVSRGGLPAPHPVPKLS
eukprot:COSAG02_NODE_36245_length_457_cov_0.818436_1_plen_72_part_01